MRKIIIFSLIFVIALSFSVYAICSGNSPLTDALCADEQIGTGYCDCSVDSCSGGCSGVISDDCITGTATCMDEGPVINTRCSYSGSCAGCFCVCKKAGSYCSTTKQCCSGSCVSNKCVSAACADTYICDSNIKATTAQTATCCEGDTGDKCYNPTTSLCRSFDHCPCTLTPLEGVWWTTPSCWWPAGKVYTAGQFACCSSSDYGGQYLIPQKIEIY